MVIADDHTLVREGTRELLSKHEDIDVVGTASDGEEAIALISAAEPDVALVDIAMPSVTGIEVTRRVSKQQKSVAILILTVHDEEPYVRALLEAGAAGYLLKDVGETELVRSIRAVHSGEAVLHPGLTRGLFESLMKGNDSSDPAAKPLTERETEVLLLAARGLSNRQIATDLSISPRTVQTHLTNMFDKLDVASRTQAVIRGLRNGWLTLEELE